MIASIIAKLSTAIARWPKKLIAPSPNPPEFKELDAPALLGRLKKTIQMYSLSIFEFKFHYDRYIKRVKLFCNSNSKIYDKLTIYEVLQRQNEDF